MAAQHVKLGKLLGSAHSTCTQRVLTVVYENGGELPIQEINFAEQEHKKEPFIKLQPFGQVPVLVQDDGFSLFESRAISRYADVLYGGKLSHIHDKKKYAKTENWISVETFHFDPAASGIVGELVFKKIFYNQEPDLAKVETLKQKLHTTLAVYDKHLATNTFLIGDDLSLADLFHLPYGSKAFSVLPEFLEKYPNVKRWFEQISAIPAWKKASGAK